MPCSIAPPRRRRGGSRRAPDRPDQRGARREGEPRAEVEERPGVEREHQHARRHQRSAAGRRPARADRERDAAEEDQRALHRHLEARQQRVPRRRRERDREARAARIDPPASRADPRQPGDRHPERQSGGQREVETRDREQVRHTEPTEGVPALAGQAAALADPERRDQRAAFALAREPRARARAQPIERRERTQPRLRIGPAHQEIGVDQ